MPAVDCSLDDIYHMFLSDGLVQGDERASRRSVVLYSSHGDGANNLVRCFLGAGAAAAINPFIKRIGVQWTYVSVFTSLLGIIPLLLLVYNKGWAWRREQMGVQI